MSRGDLLKTRCGAVSAAVPQPSPMFRTYQALVTFCDDGLIVVTLKANTEEEGAPREDQLVLDKLLTPRTGK